MADGSLAPTEGGNGDGIIGGPKTPQQIAAHRRLQQTQAQVDEVVNIISANVEKVLDRDQKLSELDDRAEALQQGASQFEQQAGKLKRKFWLQNLKLIIIGGVVALIIIALFAYKFVPDSPPQHFAHTSQPEVNQSNRKPSNQETPPASSTQETQAKLVPAITEQTSGKSQSPPGGNKQMFSDPSYLLNLK